jgi:hypothetical protein
MDFDEHSNSEFPVALNAPRRFNETENGIDGSLASSLEACTSARLLAPGHAKIKVNLAAMVFGLKCMQARAASSAAPLPSPSTIN